MMSERQKLFFWIFSIVAFSMAMVVLAKNAEAYTVGNVRLLTLDAPTLERGFSVKSYDEKMWLPVFPRQYQSPVVVKIATLDEGTPTPNAWQAVSNKYAYGFETGKPGILEKPILLALHPHGTVSAAQVVHYYDKYHQAWRPLPTQHDYQNQRVIATTIFPYAEVAVFEPSLEPSNEAFTARSYIVMDTLGNVLAEKNADVVRPVASLTKLMTAAVFLDHNPGWDTLVTMSASDNVGGASLPVALGDRLSTRDLFYSTLTASKNNTARALMRSTGLSEAQFVQKMNEKARHWGLTKTVFVEPTGLSENNISTAREMMEISRRTLNNEYFSHATSVRVFDVTHYTQDEKKTMTIFNTNSLIGRDVPITGGKTGYTTAAGYNLVSRAKNDRHEVVALVLGAQIRQNYEEVYRLLKKFL